MTIRKHIDNDISIIKKFLDKDRYIYFRYNIPFCFMLLETKENNIDKIKKYLRKSDEIFVIDKNLIGVIFRFVDMKSGGYDAAKKLLNYLETVSKSNIYGGIACSEGDIKNIENRAFFALKKAKTKNFSNFEDDHYF